MKRPGPILVVDLFPETLDSLVKLMAGLSSEEWERPTAAGSWTVKDVASHLLGGEIGLLSRKRDRHLYSGSPIIDWDRLVVLINELNAVWVKASSRISPRLLCDLMRYTGEQTSEYFKSLDQFAMGDPVDWTGPGPAPVWLDLAREYTERWHHQQQIRDAVGKPGLKEPRYMAPVIDAFVRALPHTYRDVSAEEGTLVGLMITGASGGRWLILREGPEWNLYVDAGREPDAEVVIDEETAWRLFTKGVKPDEARAKASISGNQSLGLKALDMISIIG
ncbi:MAG TPA: maleylpyruvate isomerase family mycothiol-dependent enzyme [Blastocatellia bacterium]|nr:maleylpyruvate isomerase family mycothiol-dependent enzyme [Blastocatellia bacterium]